MFFLIKGGALCYRMLVCDDMGRKWLYSTRQSLLQFQKHGGCGDLIELSREFGRA